MDDPIQATIYDGIKRSIKVCLEHQCFGAAVTLIYSGIDTMAFLGMPEGQEDVGKADFVGWCERYLKMPGRIPVAGIEWYAARCAVLHTHGVKSKLSREGKARMIAYMDKAVPEVRHDPSLTPPLVMISIDALATAFFDGIDKFLIDIFTDKAKRELAEKRLPWLLVAAKFTDMKAAVEST